MSTDFGRVANLPPVERFTTAEVEILQHYVTNTDLPVFALRNLPEVVKGALFARYSRSNKSLRRLLLDEFREDLPYVSVPHSEGHRRAHALYERVFNEYGDDSVAQLGGAHLACEGVSNVLTKILERGRLMSYLEQSTRYVPYTDQIEGAWKYHVPQEIDPRLRQRYCEVIDSAFATYASLLDPIEEYYRVRFPRNDVAQGAYNRTIRAKALDDLRGLLPSATRSNLGIYGSGQAYEALLIRLRASELSETRDFAELILQELRKVIPAFLIRVDRPDRGVAWSEYLAEVERDTCAKVKELFEGNNENIAPDVMLTDFDPHGEIKVVAAALYAASSLPDGVLLNRAQKMSFEERLSVLRAYVGNRKNRRHRPGRAFERTHYRFDIVADYGAFRDLQRHRLLTLDWQTLSPDLGYIVPESVKDLGMLDRWTKVMSESADLYQDLASHDQRALAPYALSMAYRVRFYMEMNAREAMHIIELRSAPQGHATYRRVVQEMHRLISNQAGHKSIAAAMWFTNHEEVGLERLEAEKAMSARINSSGNSDETKQ